MTRSEFVRKPLATVIDRYDRLAPWYRFAEPTILLRPGFRRQAVQRLGLAACGQHVLEIGCGTGGNLRFPRAAVGARGRVTGVDISQRMLAPARKTISRQGWQNVPARGSGRGRPLPVNPAPSTCCDAYNAMTTTRPYREAMAQTVAIAELVKNAGRQFDPRVIDALIAATGAGALSTADGWSS